MCVGHVVADIEIRVRDGSRALGEEKVEQSEFVIGEERCARCECDLKSYLLPSSLSALRYARNSSVLAIRHAGVDALDIQRAP